MENTSYAEVSHLFCYPIKSTHELSLEKSLILPSGLLNDRKLVIVRKSDLSFICLSQPSIFSNDSELVTS